MSKIGFCKRLNERPPISLKNLPVEATICFPMTKTCLPSRFDHWKARNNHEEGLGVRFFSELIRFRILIWLNLLAWLRPGPFFDLLKALLFL